MIPKEIADNTTTSKASSSTSSTTSWSRFKDPRIVRVSRAFGGKDRHSKVCTVRGLRDRRVRLSVSTAIQLYDLQDRLGLNQPSKVIDWLLNAAKHEIDELPPLQIPQGINFSQYYDPIHDFRASHDSDKQGVGISLGKSKDVREASDHRDHENLGRSGHDQEEIRQFNLENNPSFLLNSTMPPFVRWDPSNLSLSQPPQIHGSTAPQIEDWRNLSLVPLPSTLSLPNSGSHQFLVYQHAGMSSTQSYFPMNTDFDMKQPNFHSSNVEHSNAQPARPIHFGMTANLLPPQNENEQNKSNEFHSRQH
ncbi:hypothetical protein BUALT_Bualt04G0135500 [Buddleja alternifolia]|uniref:TCP domain-containing protein n=1 Tax=Buddleja alternifolia TaxID=168488 RepID=A0AAV6XWP7_9LAMI|nr:hypothetical protein BUALT_Bualt04G0135500 [Buddleja alternifolia]